MIAVHRAGVELAVVVEDWAGVSPPNLNGKKKSNYSCLVLDPNLKVMPVRSCCFPAWSCMVVVT